MERTNQDRANSAGIIDDIRRTVCEMVEHEMECSEAMRCATAAAQALSNVVTGHQQLQLSLMEQELAKSATATDTVFWRLLASISSQTNTAGLVLLLNSLKGNSETTKLLCSTEPGRLVASKLGQLFGDNEDDESDGKAMLFVLLSQITECGGLPLVLGSDPELNAYGLIDALAVHCSEHALPADYERAISKDLVTMLTRLLLRTQSILVRVWDESDEVYLAEDIGCDVDMSSIMAAHRCLAAIVSVLGLVTAEGNERIIAWVLECKTLNVVISLLGLLNKHLPRIESAQARQNSLQAANDTSSDADESIARLFMFKRDLIRIIGNVGHGNAAARDLVRELGGLSLVLDHMKIDDNHPFIKEYAVVALKGLLCDNQASQDFVREMEAVQAAQNPGLSRAGLQATVAKDGRVSIVRARHDDAKAEAGGEIQSE
ncbi:Ataxin-10 [Coemansia sp. RSA 2322]|nr:Ataxin-10 [Coemansia sp. RSA 2322]